MADFETTTESNYPEHPNVAYLIEEFENGELKNIKSKFKTRVWGYGICNINDPDMVYFGTSITEMFEWIKERQGNVRLYFHNLKFDGEFILYWLFENGFIFTNNRPVNMPDNSFSTLISDKGIFYSITIKISGKIIDIIDSAKILPFKVSDIAKGFDLEEQKLEIDYNEERPIGHTLTIDEKLYIQNDVVIVAKALKVLFDQGMNKMTQGSNALADYKKVIGIKNYKRNFPLISYDSDLRPSYKGGWVYVNPIYQKVELGKMIGLDVVSLYPWVMHSQPLPYGHGMFFNGKYVLDYDYPLYIQRLSCQFKLKKDFVPTIQLKGNLRFNPVEYLTSSISEKGIDSPVTLTLTSVDLNLFLEHYEVYNIEWLSGWKFRSTRELFKPYINKWFEVKREAAMTGNKPMKQLAKLMLNALYGKTASAPHGRSKYPYYEDGLVKYSVGELEDRKAVYLPVGTFITAWARDKTIRAAQKNIDRWVYSDTDSLYLLGKELPNNLTVGTDLGNWEYEKEISRAKFLRQKSYIMDAKDPKETEYRTIITCAGMPESCHKHVSWENFETGNKIPGKLQANRVKGGVVLLPTSFTFG